jgi:hypothetical protein
VGRVDEQPIELGGCAVDRNHDREGDRRLIVRERNPDPAVSDEGPGKLDRIGVRRELFAILLPNVRRSAL